MLLMQILMDWISTQVSSTCFSTEYLKDVNSVMMEILMDLNHVKASSIISIKFYDLFPFDSLTKAMLSLVSVHLISHHSSFWLFL
jgi:hypothetical protein